jgi:hypothetical protein
MDSRNNVGNPIINLPLGDGLKQPFMVMTWDGLLMFIVGFTWVYHITSKEKLVGV